MRNILILIAVMLLAITVALGVAYVKPNTSSAPAPDQPPPPDSGSIPGAAKLKTFYDVQKGAIHATIDVEGKGSIKLELYPEAAPKTVQHFVDLCKRKFYDGMLVHRVEMLTTFRLFQVGDPATKKLKQKDLRGKTSAEVHV